MPLYRYEALDPAGKKVVGAMQVSDEPALRARLQSMGYRPTLVEAAGRAGAAAPSPRAGAGAEPSRRASSLSAPERSVARLFNQLHTAIRAGMPAAQALGTVAGQVPEPALRRALGEMEAGVRAGRPISAMMELHPRLFTRGDTGTVRAAEVGGFLPEALASLAALHDEEETTRRRLAVWVWFFHLNALSLPLFIPLGVFLRDVMPSFQVSAGLAGAGRAFLTVSVPLMAAYCLAAALLGRFRRSPGLARAWHALQLRLPVAGKIARLRACAVFARTLQQLSLAGVPVATAWATAAGAVPNSVLAARLAGAASLLEGGRPSVALERSRLFDAADAGLLATGESTGEVPQALDYLAGRYEEECRVALGASVARGAVSFGTWSLLIGAVAFGVVMYFYGQGLMTIVEE